VAVVSPAAYTQAEKVEQGCARLRDYGYEPVVMPHALARGPLYYAGTAAQRAEDLRAAFADASIDAVLCTRGGWGSMELLPLLDAQLVRANPKLFVGYSDATSLHTWLWNECGLATVHGPMVAADWAREDGLEERTWLAAAEGVGTWSVGAADGLRVLCAGEAEGRLLGGCLSILEAGLGTPWALRTEEPCVLWLEDTGVKPYQWDRMLRHLRFAGAMEQVRGVVFGDMGANVEPREMDLMEAACLHGLGGFAGPVMLGLKSGHVPGANRSVPLGAWVRMSAAGLFAVE